MRWAHTLVGFSLGFAVALATAGNPAPGQNADDNVDSKKKNSEKSKSGPTDKMSLFLRLAATCSNFDKDGLMSCSVIDKEKNTHVGSGDVGCQDDAFEMIFQDCPEWKPPAEQSSQEVACKYVGKGKRDTVLSFKLSFIPPLVRSGEGSKNDDAGGGKYPTHLDVSEDCKTILGVITVERLGTSCPTAELGKSEKTFLLKHKNIIAILAVILVAFVLFYCFCCAEDEPAADASEGEGHCSELRELHPDWAERMEGEKQHGGKRREPASSDVGKGHGGRGHHKKGEESRESKERRESHGEDKKKRKQKPCKETKKELSSSEGTSV